MLNVKTLSSSAENGVRAIPLMDVEIHDQPRGELCLSRCNARMAIAVSLKTQKPSPCDGKA